MCLVVSIFEADCFLILKDNDCNVLAEFNLSETTFTYSNYTFTIKDYRYTYEVKIDDIVLINNGNYTTFHQLYADLVELRRKCRCKC
jgi:hypothetical protein